MMTPVARRNLHLLNRARFIQERLCALEIPGAIPGSHSIIPGGFSCEESGIQNIDSKELQHKPSSPFAQELQRSMSPRMAPGVCGRRVESKVQTSPREEGKFRSLFFQCSALGGERRSSPEPTPARSKAAGASLRMSPPAS
jgi:hypothetical protein